MIRLLVFLILAAIVLPLTYFRFKQFPLVKRMIISGGALAAAAVALLMQESYAWYIVALALVGVSFLAAFAFAKIITKERQEKLRIAEERREQKLQQSLKKSAVLEKAPAIETDEKPMSFGMQSIDAEREEITRG
ncbi:hypothetical protein [Planococcus donghaensis]|uniref:Uncharacterized protein n=1 Tax=Planococcus donghaensis TaxID=414778 RepID=A0A1C7EHR6_9BACL|nr:hypothetical protein [Planococcus donghaensis]ANU23603.1 hypothetical protein BCM40_09540 [Planococcus donghaensis]